MKNIIKIIFGLTLLSGLGSACLLIWMQTGSDLSLATWNITKNTAAYDCTKIDNGTSIFLRCASTSSPGANAYVVLYGKPYDTIISPQGFTVTMEVSFNPVGASPGTECTGIVLPSSTASALCTSSSYTGLKYYNATHAVASCFTDGLTTNYTKFDYGKTKTFILEKNMNSDKVYIKEGNGNLISSCSLGGGGIGLMGYYRPFIAITGTATTYPSNIDLNGIDVISDVTLTGNFRVFSEPYTPQGNCTVSAPYDSNILIPPSKITQGNGLTGDFDIQPLCTYSPPAGWQNAGISYASCVNGYNGYGIFYANSNYSNNQIFNITISGPTTTTTLPGDGNNTVTFLTSVVRNGVIIQNLSNSKVTLSSSAGGNYIQYTDLNGIADFGMAMGNTYTVKAENSPNYPEKTFFISRDFIDYLFDQAINGYVLLDFDYRPIYSINLHVNKNNYDIDMTDNEVYVYGCGQVAEPESCINGLISNQYTDINGDWGIGNILINFDRYIMVRTRYPGDINTPELIDYQIIDLNQIYDYQVNVSLAYGFVQTYPIYFGFFDFVNGSRVNSVTYDISKQGVSLKNGTTSTDEYFNSTSPLLYYIVNANANGYIAFSGNKEFDTNINPNRILMTSITPDTNYLYFVMGQVLNISGTTLNNIKVTSSCGNQEYYTNSTGHYIFTGISKGSSCIIQTNTYGAYNDYSREITLNSNVTGFDFTLTPSGEQENNRLITFTVYTLDIYGDYEYLENVRITLKCSGYNNVVKLTNSQGKALFQNSIMGCDYSYDVELNNYNSLYDINLGRYENNPLVQLFRETGNDCSVGGRIQKSNNSVIQDIPNNEVQLYKNGRFIDSINTDSNGAYEFDILCDSDYSIKTTFNGETKEVEFHSKSIEGGNSVVNIIFDLGAVTSTTFTWIYEFFIAIISVPVLIIAVFLLLILYKLSIQFTKDE